MRYNLPKPPHGWGQLAWEVGVVVLGVLIALAAQQEAEKLNDRSGAAETRADIWNELNSDLTSLTLRERAEFCIERRLIELRRLLAQWEQTGSFDTPKCVAQTPVIEIELSRYDAALSAGRTTLLPVTSSIVLVRSQRASEGSTSSS